MKAKLAPQTLLEIAKARGFGQSEFMLELALEMRRLGYSPVSLPTLVNWRDGKFGQIKRTNEVMEAAASVLRNVRAARTVRRANPRARVLK